jgi:DNA invertase Pin-like site-specific DNA recombinase
LRAGIYARVSTPEQTLDGQEAELVAYCRARGWTPVVFRDVQSGAAATRPGLAAMMEAARRREISAVVCVKLDRLGRSLAHFAALLHELQTLGVGLVCVSQGIDTVAEPGRLNPAAHFFVTVLAAVAEFERELIRERTRDGLKAARARGSRLGRPPSVTAAQRQEILRLHHEGKSCRAIAREVKLAPSTVWLVLRPGLGVEKGAAWPGLEQLCALVRLTRSARCILVRTHLPQVWRTRMHLGRETAGLPAPLRASAPHPRGGGLRSKAPRCCYPFRQAEPSAYYLHRRLP